MHNAIQLLAACIVAELRAQAFSPPTTPNAGLRDQYFSDAALKVVTAIEAAGWVILSPRSPMTPEAAREDLTDSVRFGLRSFQLKPPRSRHLDDWQRYYGWVADEVIRQIQRTAWEVSESALRKLPGSGWPISGQQ